MMKKIYSLLLCSGLLTTALAQQQIPNGDFETWETIPYESTSYEAPSPWDPGSFCASSGASAVCSVAGTKTTDAASGDFAMKLASEDGFQLALLENYPATGTVRSISAEFMAKTDISIGAYFIATVYFHNGDFFDDPESVGSFRLSTNKSTSTYTKFSDEIRFFKTIPYEFITIILNFDESDFSGASSVTIDDFKFIYDIETGVNDVKGSQQTISATVINNELSFDKTISSFEILGQRGEQLLKGSSQQVDVSELSTGVYFVKAITKNAEVFTYRVFKQ